MAKDFRYVDTFNKTFLSLMKITYNLHLKKLFPVFAPG